MVTARPTIDDTTAQTVQFLIWINSRVAINYQVDGDSLYTLTDALWRVKIAQLFFIQAVFHVASVLSVLPLQKQRKKGKDKWMEFTSKVRLFFLADSTLTVFIQ